VHGITDNEEEDTRDDLKGVADITSCGGRKVIDHLEERGEVAVPAVVGDHVDEVQKTDTDNGAAGEELEAKEWLRGNEALVSTEDGQENDAQNDHRNDVGGVPTLRGAASNGEGKEEDDKASGEQESTSSIELDESPLDVLQERSTARLIDKESLLLGLLEVVLQENVHGDGDDGKDNGECSKAPSPLVTVSEEGLGRFGTSEGSDHVGRRGEGVCKTSVLELCGIGRDNVDTVGETGPANLPEDL
jgi:hypothetical protein